MFFLNFVQNKLNEIGNVIEKHHKTKNEKIQNKLPILEQVSWNAGVTAKCMQISRDTGQQAWVHQLFCHTWSEIVCDFSQINFFDKWVYAGGVKDTIALRRFQEKALSIIRPPVKSTFGIHDPTGLSYLTQLRVGLSKLDFHKFKYNFRDTCKPDMSYKWWYWGYRTLLVALPLICRTTQSPSCWSFCFITTIWMYKSSKLPSNGKTYCTVVKVFPAILVEKCSC